MKTESNARKRRAADGGGDSVDKTHGWTKEPFHSIHVDASSSSKKTQMSKNNREFFSVHWILAPLLLSWGVWNCVMVPHVLNFLAAITIAALLLLSMVSTSTQSTSDDSDVYVDEDNLMQLRINVLPSMNAWFSFLSRASNKSRKPEEPQPVRLHRSTSTTSTFSSDSELEYAVRCSESTIAIDDDFDMYQDEVFEPEDDEIVWVAPDALNSWMVAPAAKTPAPANLPQAAPVAAREAPHVVTPPSVLVVPTPTKRKMREESSTTAGRPVSTKRFIVASPPKRLPKSSLCRSPEIRRMMEELERMQDESDALVVAAESVGVGARCTMNDRLRRLHRG